MPSKIQSILLESIVAGVKTAVASDTTSAVPQDTKEIAQAVQAEVAPIVANATNQEPWYQSRIIVTQIVQYVAALLGVIGYVTAPEYVNLIVTVVLAVTGAIGPSYTLYARLKQGLKPLGS